MSHQSYQEGSSQTGQVTFVSTCAAVSVATSGLLDDTSVIVSWTDAIVTDIDYSVEYKLHDDTTWNIAGQTTAHNYQIDDLDEGSEYDFRVQKICATDTYSPYTSAGSITTNYPACAAVTNIVITPSSFSASMTWTGVSNANDYKVYLNNVLKTTTSSTNYTFTNLTDNTSYSVRIETECTGTPTNPSVTTSFSTVVFVCNTITNLVLTGTSSTLTGTWTPVIDAIGYAYSINNGLYINVTDPTFTANVSANTAYTVSVIAYCPHSKTSLPVSGSYTTPAGCSNITNFTEVVSYPSGVPNLSLSWTPAGGATGYGVYIDNSLVYTISSGSASSWDSISHSITLSTGTHSIKLVTICGSASTSGVSSNYTVASCSPVTGASMTITEESSMIYIHNQSSYSTDYIDLTMDTVIYHFTNTPASTDEEHTIVGDTYDVVVHMTLGVGNSVNIDVNGTDQTLATGGTVTFSDIVAPIIVTITDI